MTRLAAFPAYPLNELSADETATDIAWRAEWARLEYRRMMWRLAAKFGACFLLIVAVWVLVAAIGHAL